MRRLIVEITEEDLSKFDDSEFLSMIKLYDIVHLLRFDKEEFAAIVRLQFKDGKTRIEDLMSHGDLKRAKVQLLERDKDGVCTYFMAGKTGSSDQEAKILSFGGYLSTPFEVRNGKVKMAFLGEPKQLKNLLQIGEEMGLCFKVASLADAKFSPESPLNDLTEKQREVIVSAFEHGYYETPRRVSSQELARKLKLKSSTVVEHRRKAEQRLLSKIIKAS